MNRRIRSGCVALIVATFLPLHLSAQQRGGPAASARARAPIDITGYWTALITDDWEYRMVTPQKGQIQFIPLNDAARKAANAWDPARDEQAGLQCKGYGAAGVMRLPTRLHITWQDDDTLKVETDFGTQTRLFRFAAQQPPSERTWQGTSLAQWEGGPARGGRGALTEEQILEAALQNPGGAPNAVPAAGAAAAPVNLSGALKVVTTNLRAGYLRKNGVPYSENAVLTEWFNLLGDGGVRYLAIQTQVDDPTYLTAPFFRTLQFKKEPDGGKWNPTSCSAR
jgi:hypothetical protein